MDRIVEVKVGGNHLSKDNKNAGVRGEANVTRLRISFDEGWDGYAKTVTFWDARGENPVERTLTTDLLENIAENTRVYLIPIPAEPMAEAGQLTFVIDGYIDGKRQRSLSDKLEVKDAPIAEGAAEPADPTPTQAEQLQAQIDAVLETIQNAAIAENKASGYADKAGIAAQSAAESEEKTEELAESILQNIQDYGSIVNRAYVQDGILYICTSDGKTFAAGKVQGDKGDTGNAGVHIGAEEPTDEAVRVWIDPSDHDTLDEIMDILDSLQFTDGGVQVDVSAFVKKKDANAHKHSAADITEGALPVVRGGHGGETAEEARDNLGLSYVSASYGTDAIGDPAFVVEIPGITEMKAGIVARIIPEEEGDAFLEVNGLASYPMCRRGVDGGRKQIPYLMGGVPLECVFDGTYWVFEVVETVNKPKLTELDGILPVSKGGTGKNYVGEMDIPVGDAFGGYSFLQPDDLRMEMGAPKMVEGTYTGNGAASRTITTGGKPAILLFTNSDDESVWITTRISVNSTATAQVTMAPYYESATPNVYFGGITLTQTGFTITGAGLNEYGFSYTYRAIID